MSPITIANKRLLWLAVLLSAAIGGCSQKYRRSDLGPDSEQVKQVCAMVGRLRDAGSAGLDEYIAAEGAENLSDQQRKGLRSALEKIIEADEVELVRMDKFGENVYRVGFDLTGRNRQRVFFLIIDKGDKLLWAGKN